MTSTQTKQSVNRQYYNKVWKRALMFEPHEWASWEVIKDFLGSKNLELGPGAKPKIPIAGNFFVDISYKALKRLKLLGAYIHVSDLKKRLPFPDKHFDLVCAFELLEHIPNDLLVLKEISRVLKIKGHVLISFPVNMEYWCGVDEAVGHARRYQPETIENIFQSARLKIVQYAILPVPWPGKYTGFLLGIIVKIFPQFLSFFQDIIDKSPFTALKQPIHLKPWRQNSWMDAKKATTIFLVAILR